MQDLLAGQIDFMIEPASNFKSLLARRQRQAVRDHRQGAAEIRRRTSRPRTRRACPASRLALVRVVGAEGHAEGHHRQTERHHGAGAGRPAGADSASRNSASRSRRRDSNRRKRCGCFRRPKPSAGGRSSRRRISRWSSAVIPGRCAASNRSLKNPDAQLRRCGLVLTPTIPGMTARPTRRSLANDGAHDGATPSPASAGSASPAPPAASACPESWSSSR